MEKIKNKKFLIYLVTILALSLIIFLNTPLDTQTIPTKFIAGENPGFDLTPGALNFGKIILGSSATRTITITNTHNSPTLTKITSSGKISPYIIVSQNNIILNPNQSKNLTFSVYPEKGIPLEEYPGQIIITTHKA